MNHQRNEGRQHAIDCIRAVIGASSAWFDSRGPVATVIDNLELTARRFPVEYAQGVIEVCREVRQ